MPSVDFNRDFKVKFRDYVLEDLEVSSLIGSRFNGAHLATFYNDATTFPLATFTSPDGELSNQGIIARFFEDINCYSNQHYDEAYEVDRVILERLGGSNGPIAIDGNIIVRPVTTPQESYDVEARLYRIFRRYHITFKS